MQKTPPYLKLLVPDTCALPIPDTAEQTELRAAFAAATGWTLRDGPPKQTLPDSKPRQSSQEFDAWTAPENPGDGIPPGHHAVELGTPARKGVRPRVSRTGAVRLTAAIDAMLAEIARLREAVWQREAELAAGVPVLPRLDEQEHLAARLQAAIKAGAESVGCVAAAVYMLDEATSELKLRAVWGLPFNRLLNPARPLRGAVADLEALLGHAVVLDSPELCVAWSAPEGDFPAAVCVPISTPTVPLGTLWFFASRPREFSDSETNLAELTAGRVSAELEREMLLNAQVGAARQDRGFAAAEEMQLRQLPQSPWKVEGWEFHGEARQAEPLGGAFFDWWPDQAGHWLVAAGRALESGTDAALCAAAIRAALRAHADHLAEPGEILERVNRALWTGSTGDQYGHVWLARVSLSDGAVRYAAAGECQAWREGRQRRALSVQALPLGIDGDAIFTTRQVKLSMNETLTIDIGGSSGSEKSQPSGEQDAAALIVRRLDALPKRDRLRR